MKRLIGLVTFVGAMILNASQSAYGQDVTVVNSEKNPVPTVVLNPLEVRDQDNPARQPFARRVRLVVEDRMEVSSTPHMFLVPEGKRLVIEYISARGYSAPGSFLRPSITVGVPYFFIGTAQGNFDANYDAYATSQETRLYADPGSWVSLSLWRTGTTGDAYSDIAISGYLVDVP